MPGDRSKSRPAVSAATRLDVPFVAPVSIEMPSPDRIPNRDPISARNVARRAARAGRSG